MITSSDYKKSATLTGVFFLTAMVTSLLGAVLLESVIAMPDWLTTILSSRTQVYAGIYLELINAIAVIGIAVMLFRVLKAYNENIALGYLGFRIIESMVCIVAAICPLLLITLGQQHAEPGGLDNSHFQTFGHLIYAVRGYMAGLLLPIFFSLGALLFYYVMYRSKLIPRFLSVWGFAGVVLMLGFNLSGTESSLGLIFVLPIILNEIFLGIWLIIKGFSQFENWHSDESSKPKKPTI